MSVHRFNKLNLLQLLIKIESTLRFKVEIIVKFYSQTHILILRLEK